MQHVRETKNKEMEEESKSGSCKQNKLITTTTKWPNLSDLSMCNEDDSIAGFRMWTCVILQLLTRPCILNSWPVSTWTDCSASSDIQTQIWPDSTTLNYHHLTPDWQKEVNCTEEKLDEQSTDEHKMVQRVEVSLPIISYHLIFGPCNLFFFNNAKCLMKIKSCHYH